MFKCKVCQAKESEIAWLKGRIQALEATNSKLTDKVIAMANAPAFQALNYTPGNPEEFYGGDDDEMVNYHPIYGNKIITTKVKE